MQYVSGLKAGLSVLFGFVPVGIAYAVLASQAGFSPLETMLMSMTVFAGASQIMAVGMYAQGAGIAAIAITTMTACMNAVLSSFMDSSWALIASTLACAFLGVFFVDTGDE